MTTAEHLRKLAKELRETSKNLNEEKTQKCAQILVAAQGLNALRQRLIGEAGR